MITLALAQMVYFFSLQAPFTGGEDGIQGVPRGKLFGLIGLDNLLVMYALVLVIFLAGFGLIYRIVHSPFGLSLRAVKGNLLRARAVGISSSTRIVAIYTLAAVYAGVAGGLTAQTSQFVSLDVFDFHRSADVMLVLVLGGTGYLYGGIIGALIFRLMQDWLAGITPQYWQFWIGLVLVLVVLVGRERIEGLPRGLLGLLRRLMGRPAAEGTRP
jgi:branched-chain amino acid transport system permease protein